MNVAYLIDYKGQEYLVDITYRSDMDYRTECAIFKTENAQFTFEDALPLYRKMDVDWSYDALEECIDEFIKQLG